MMRDASPAVADCAPTLRLRVGNIGLLREVYGTQTAESVLALLAQRLAAVFAGRGIPAHISSDADGIRAALPSGPANRDAFPAIVDAALLALGSQPVTVDGTAVLAAMSAFVEAGRNAPPCRTTPTEAPDPRTRDDMAIAVATFEAVAAGRLYFLFQSIAGATDASATLYREGFARIVDRTTDDELQTPRGFMPALERLGLTRAFDRAVVEGGIAFLIDNPTARVGCNISALSAIDDAWWAPLLDRLATAPELAKRLVVEITETAPRGDIDPILGFIRAFRQVGCRIAIDNFGAGFSGLRFAVAAAPDIIKIDACYVREQAAAAFGATYLGHLVGLARCLAADVVVVGIENESDLERARATAANWVQGRHVAPASLSRGGASRLVEVVAAPAGNWHRHRSEVFAHRLGGDGTARAVVADG